MGDNCNTIINLPIFSLLRISYDTDNNGYFTFCGYSICIKINFTDACV